MTVVVVTDFMNEQQDLLERLSHINTVRGVVIEINSALENAMDHMIRSAFRKEEYAVKFAIEPLLGQAGPLSDPTVRLKLIYALGLLPTKMYQDMERLLRLQSFLAREPREYSFSDPKIVEEFTALNMVKQVSFKHLQPPEQFPNEDPLDFQMRLRRHQTVVKSTLALAVDEIIQHLLQRSPI